MSSRVGAAGFVERAALAAQVFMEKCGRGGVTKVTVGASAAVDGFAIKGRILHREGFLKPFFVNCFPSARIIADDQCEGETHFQVSNSHSLHREARRPRSRPPRSYNTSIKNVENASQTNATARQLCAATVRCSHCSTAGDARSTKSVAVLCRGARSSDRHGYAGSVTNKPTL